MNEKYINQGNTNWYLVHIITQSIRVTENNSTIKETNQMFLFFLNSTTNNKLKTIITMASSRNRMVQVLKLIGLSIQRSYTYFQNYKTLNEATQGLY